MQAVLRLPLIGVVALVLVALLITPNARATEPQAAVQTLILTNKTRLTELYGSAAVDSLIIQLNQLAAHGTVNGSVIFVEETPAIASAYTAWQTNPTDTAQANAVADAIRTLIIDKTPTTPDLRYIVLVGDDRVVPYRRTLDEVTVTKESGYDQVPATTTVGAALENDQILTDDFYGDIQVTQPITLYLPELAVGRLVETPVEMEAAITQFLQSDGKIVVTNNLVAGFDFIADAAQATCTLFARVEWPTDCDLIGNSWTATMLDSKLQSGAANVIFLYAASNHWQTSAPTGTVTSTLMSAWPLPSGGRLIYTVGDHAGLNVPPETTQPLDWPQAWLAQGAVAIASTGYDFGKLNGIGLSEKLANDFALNLISLDATVGDALIIAKRTYVAEETSFDRYDHKIVAEVVLHGLPMYKVEKFTDSATATPTPSSTPTPTPTVTPSVTATPVSGDSYEGDDVCGIAHAIGANGEAQPHTFHQLADVDWISFDAVASTDYRIEVNIPDTSPADVNLELYTVCDGVLVDQWHASFSPGVRLDFTPATTGKVYVRLANFDATVAGAHVRYEVSVHNLTAAPPQRALVIVAGRLRGSDRLQKNIHTIAEAVYQTFQRNGYTDDNIHYLATNASLLGYDAAASKASLRTAITQWAVDKVKNNGVFTLYLIDHGHPETFYIDELSGQRVSPDELNGWLNELEAAAPGVTVNVIIEACQSGSFIDKPSSISKAGRMVITSTNAQHDAKASQQGAYFSDHLLTQLSQGYNLAASFRAAQQVAKQVYVFQEAWLDVDGNGVANEFGDATLAAQRGFAYAGTFGDEWAPHIFQVQPPISITNTNGIIRADVRDDAKVSQVWAVVYPPDYVAPTTSQELQAETLPSFNLTATGVEDFYAGVYPGFTQAGVYRIVIHATDNNGLVATPRTIEISVGSQLFLPVLLR